MLQGHSMDVKQVSVRPSSQPAEDGRMWYQHEDNSHSVRKIYKGHTKYVSCSVYHVEVGKIRAFLPVIEDPSFQLDGHTENVTSLFVGK
jgi:hypothetical protein